MKLPLALVFMLFFYGQSALAGVTLCELSSADGARDPILKLFEHEGTTHSAYLEFTTDYGDTLPFLFNCGINCLMSFENDDYKYELAFLPNFSERKEVLLKTISVNDDYRSTDKFSLLSCDEVP